MNWSHNYGKKAVIFVVTPRVLKNCKTPPVELSGYYIRHPLRKKNRGGQKAGRKCSPYLRPTPKQTYACPNNSPFQQVCSSLSFMLHFGARRKCFLDSIYLGFYQGFHQKIGRPDARPCLCPEARGPTGPQKVGDLERSSPWFPWFSWGFISLHMTLHSKV